MVKICSPIRKMNAVVELTVSIGDYGHQVSCTGVDVINIILVTAMTTIINVYSQNFTIGEQEN